MDLRQGLAATATNPMDSGGLDEFRKLVMDLIANRILENLNIMLPSAERRVTFVPEEPFYSSGAPAGPFPDLQEMEIPETPPLRAAVPGEEALNPMQQYWNTFGAPLVSIGGLDPLGARKAEMLARNPVAEAAARGVSPRADGTLLNQSPMLVGLPPANVGRIPNVGVGATSRKVLRDSFNRPVQSGTGDFVETMKF